MTTLRRMQSLMAIVLFTGASAFAVTHSNYTLKSTAKKVSKHEISNTASIQFDKTIIDLGQINQGIPVDIEFSFKNNGKTPLIIESVKPSCGCTVAEFPKDPIMPNETAAIKATYNAKAMGKFTKTIRVHSNAEDGPQELRFTGVVE